MILNNSPENIAILSNIKEVGEFRIKNSSKAFSILSSGLYANKIRAIIRELSCNAIDSQVAAGNGDKQFEVHLPTQLAPYFSVRDFGTGLTHDQVVNIYTTYFESTKTGSNDFIGALGLGSKSPFSYTDNFTVTAIKDGIKGIYSAFINDSGVPAIARMADIETDEPNGVEVKFAVENGNDFSKFKQESETVFTYFPIKPNMIGAKCNIKSVEYDEIDIIDGINVFKHQGYYNVDSVAVMGNIAYPIDIPNADANLGMLKKLLDKGLEIRFPIGELEFQASREGLSYTKETINAIKSKLQELQNKLDGILFSEADAIGNLWDRATFLVNKGKISIWHGSIKNYVLKNKVTLIDTSYHYIDYVTMSFPEETLAKDYNIKLSGFGLDNYKNATLKVRSEYNHKSSGYVNVWQIKVGDPDTHFIKSTKYRGTIEQAKYHSKENPTEFKFGSKIYVISKANNDLPCDFDGFFAAMYNPPENRIISQDDLLVKPREPKKTTIRNISIMKMRPYSLYGNDAKWENVYDFSTMDNTKTYYYIPLKGYTPISLDGYDMDDVHTLYGTINECGINLLKDISTIYGVRKADIEVVKNNTNWINIQEHLIDVLKNTKMENVVGAYINTQLKYKNVFNHSNNTISMIHDNDSKYKKYVKSHHIVASYENYKFTHIMKQYAPTVNTKDILAECEKIYSDLTKTYPLLWYVDSSITATQIANYVNLVDSQLKHSEMEKI